MVRHHAPSPCMSSITAESIQNRGWKNRHYEKCLYSRQVSAYIQGSVEYPDDVYVIVALDQIGDTIVPV